MANGRSRYLDFCRNFRRSWDRLCTTSPILGCFCPSPFPYLVRLNTAEKEAPHNIVDWSSRHSRFVSLRRSSGNGRSQLKHNRRDWSLLSPEVVCFCEV